MKQQMKTVIREILENEINSGLIFDAHTVIYFIIIKNNDLYENFRNEQEVHLYHSYLSKIIREFEKEEPKIIDLKVNSYSKNVNDNFSECKCWKKI